MRKCYEILIVLIKIIFFTALLTYWFQKYLFSQSSKYTIILEYIDIRCLSKFHIIFNDLKKYIYIYINLLINCLNSVIYHKSKEKKISVQIFYRNVINFLENYSFKKYN